MSERVRRMSDGPARRCPLCGKEFAFGDTAWRCCGAPLELAGPPAAPVALEVLRARPMSTWRYAEALGVPEKLWRAVTLGEGLTPLLPTRDERVEVKVEYANPTLSFKDRGVVLLIA